MARRAQVEFQLNGKTTRDWSTVGLLFKESSRYAREGVEKISRDQANRYVQEIRNIILSQDPSPAEWPELAEGYQTRKTREGHPALTYVKTGAFLESFEVRKVKAGKGSTRWFAGASPYKRHVPSGLLMRDIAHVHEYGRRSLGISAKPLFAPARERLIPQFRKEWSAWWRKMRLKARG